MQKNDIVLEGRRVGLWPSNIFGGCSPPLLALSSAFPSVQKFGQHITHILGGRVIRGAHTQSLIILYEALEGILLIGGKDSKLMRRVAVVRHEVSRTLIASTRFIIILRTWQVGLGSTPARGSATTLWSAAGSRGSLTILLAVA